MEDMSTFTGTMTRDREIVGRRVAAFLVDNVTVVTLIALVIVPPLFLMSLLTSDTSGALVAFFSLIVTLLLMALVFGVFIGYYAVFEGRWGKTPGKRLMGIEVVREDNGGVPGMKKSALRGLLLMLADGQFFCVVGFISILVTEKRQRLGDMVADTLVVRKHTAG